MVKGGLTPTANIELITFKGEVMNKERELFCTERGADVVKFRFPPLTVKGPPVLRVKFSFSIFKGGEYLRVTALLLDRASGRSMASVRKLLSR